MTGLKHRITCTHAAGFSLLEVLVGLIILAVGLLGLAGLQMKSLKQNNEAYLRSQATLQAYDILERIRANRSDAHNGWYAIDFDDIPDSADLPPTVYTDLQSWKNATQTILPGPGRGRIVTVDLSNSTENDFQSFVTVTIQWRESSEGNSTLWQEFETETEI